MSCPVITEIDRQQCIGNSLTFINSNFTNLLSGICDNIDRIDILDTQISNLNNSVVSISSVVSQGSAKAWVRFDGTQNDLGQFTTDGGRKIYSSYNIDLEETVGVEIYQDNTGTLLDGHYLIHILPDVLQNINYLVIGTSNNNTFVQPIMTVGTDTISTVTEIVIKTVNSSGVATPASNISIAIF
jgi:hypothetical protein